jgi:hypothetical protein
MSYNCKPLRKRKTAKRLYNHVDRSYYQREQCEKVADRLYAAVQAAPLDKNYKRNRAQAARMKFCSSKRNQYTATNLHNCETNKRFDGFGHFAACWAKLCSPCNSVASKRNKKRALAAVKATPLGVRTYKDYETGETKRQQERYRHIIFTMPPVFDTCLNTLSLLGDAFDRFRKSDFQKNYISGFVRGSEFTYRGTGEYAETYHAHIHLFVAGVFIPEALLKKQWTDCVEAAFKKAGRVFDPATKNGLLDVQIKYLNGTIEDELQEVCKYITKGESWSQIPDKHLLEIAAVKRWPRMFSLGGSFAETSARLKLEAAEVETHAETSAARSESYVHTKSLSDGFTKEDVSEAVEQETKAMPKARRKGWLKGKQKNWQELVEEIGVEKYEMVLAEQFEKQIDYRKRQLVKKFPFATFKDGLGALFGTPERGFIEEFAVRSEFRLVWNAPKPVVVEIEIDFDEARARAEYPAEFEDYSEYIPEEPKYFAEYIAPADFEEPEYFEFATVREMEHAAEAVAKPIMKPIAIAAPVMKPVAAAAVAEYNEFEEFGW